MGATVSLLIAHNVEVKCRLNLINSLTGGLGPRCLWRLPTRSGVSQRFCQWEKFVLMYRVSQKKAVKSNPGKILRKCNFNFFNVKNWPFLAGFETFFPSISILLIFEIE